MVLSEMLATVIVAERQRDAERRNRDMRLLHPDLDDVAPPTRSASPDLPVRPMRRGRATAPGSACEPV